jgi:peptidoglycan/xylan/chitin deacetylase (PgdA/CDA1 family)
MMNLLHASRPYRSVPPAPPSPAAVLRRTAVGGPAVAPLVVHDVVRSPGRPLDPAVRAEVEPRFGHSFAHVRVHADARAAESARAVGALAYTVGSHLVFGAGRYAPHDPAGRSLLAHELAHAVQQRGTAGAIPDALPLGAEHDPEETQADALARAAAAARPAPLPAAAGPRVMRARRTFSLTFDDGPHAAALGTGANRTEKVLDTLKARGIKAGFFIQTGVSYRGASSVGKDLVKRMHGEGHKVGIHTGGSADHELHTTAAKGGRLKSELDAAKKYIQEQTGETATLVRPPTGAFNKSVSDIYAKVSLTNLLWDMDGDQGKNLSLVELKARVASEMAKVSANGWKPSTPSPNIVVLYHDIQKGTSEHLDAVISHIEGTVKTLSDGADAAAFAAP